MITQNTDLDLSQLYGLTEGERLEAREVARRNVIKRLGPKPTRDQFSDHSQRAYPRYIVATVTVITLILLVAFFSISAMRLYSIGSETFAEKIANGAATLIAGVAIVIGSEAGALGFMLAAGVLAQEPAEKRTLYALAIASTLIALVGNVQFALGPGWRGMITSDPFAVLEAIAPPLVVLGGGLVFKRIWLDDIARHHANEKAYQHALAEYNAIAHDPEASEDWRPVFMHALKAALTRANTGGGAGVTKRREIIAAMNGFHWRQLVEAELRADDWTALEASAPAATQVVQPARMHQNQPETTIQEATPSPLSESPTAGILTSQNGNGKAG